MKILSLFLTLMATIAIWNLTSCTGSASGSSGVDSVDTSQQVEPVSVASTGDDFLGGRTPWEEFYIDSKEYGYANVRETPSKDSPVVKEIQTGEHFYGWRMEDDPDWIEVYDNDGSTIGYMWYACARHTGNKSDEGADYAEADNEEDNEDNSGYESSSDSYATSRTSQTQASPDWLHGTWRYHGTYQGTYVDLELIIQGNRLIDKWNGSVEYDGPYHYDPNLKIIAFNNGRDILPVKPDQQIIVFTGNLYYTKSSNNISSVSNSSSNSSTYSFYNPTSVIDYLNHRIFECQGLRIKFSDNGFTVNGNYGGSAPIVKSFRANYAVINVNLIPSGSLTFYVYPQQEKLVDTDGNVWRDYKSASYEH